MAKILNDPFGKPLAIEWKSEGDEWMHHLSTALGRQFDGSGFLTRTSNATEEIPSWHLVCKAENAPLHSELVVILLKNGIRALISLDADHPDEETPWISAINTATEQLGKSHKDFAWEAIIGPMPNRETGHQYLATPGAVGPLKIRSGDVFNSQYVDMVLPSLSGVGTFCSWPIIVEGVSTGYNWDVASEAASRALHQLCSLLSVAWDRCWILRQSPSENKNITIPEKLCWEKRDDESQTAEHPRNSISLPPWADSAWRTIDANPTIANALSVHQEGLRLEYEHPSFALIAFIASIETIGGKLFDVSRCERCGAVLGSTDRFRKTLRIVLSEEEAKVLDKAYTPRSKTAHAGVLHGMETVFGFVNIEIFDMIAGTGPRSFAFSVVRKMRQANRKLLEKILRGEIALSEGK